jgi:hypothetical protein
MLADLGPIIASPPGACLEERPADGPQGRYTQ